MCLLLEVVFEFGERNVGDVFLCICCLKLCLDLGKEMWERDWVLIDCRVPLETDQSSAYSDEQDRFALKRFEFNQ